MNRPEENSVSRETEAIEARALEFLQRRNLSRWTVSDEAELEAWLAEDTAHRVTFLRYAAVEGQIERTIESEPDTFLAMLPAPRRKYTRLFLGLAASLTITAGITVWVVTDLLGTEDRTYSTDVGGRASLALSDGTQIVLNTDTAVRVRTSARERTVWLDRGEAFFQVTHDAQRPFVVIAERRRVTDLGTEFLVRSESNRFEVTLLQGRAQYSADAQKSQIAMLTPGDDVVATPTTTVFAKKSKQDIADEMSWRTGVLKFRHTPLAQAVSEYNRYYRTKLIIRDPVVARLPIGGDFQIAGINGFLDAMQVVLHLHVEQTGDVILIGPASSKSDEEKAQHRQGSETLRGKK